MKNKYEIRGDVTIIYLKKKTGKSFECLIDTNDLEKMIKFPHTWHVLGCDDIHIYARGLLGVKNNKKISVLMHRFLVDCPEEYIIDHINGDTLDNRRENLRIVSNAENCQNRRSGNRDSKSGIRGVHWDKQSNKWKSLIYVGKNKYYLGLYDDKEKAGEIASKARAILMTHSNEPKEYINIKVTELLRTNEQGYRNNKSSGIRGVSWHKIRGKWGAYLGRNKKQIILGYYDDIEDAAAAVAEARKNLA